MMSRLLRWEDWSLAVRGTVFITVLISVIVFASTINSLRREEANFRGELQQQAEVLLSGLSGAAGDALYNGDIDTVDDLITGLGRREVLVSGRAYDADGRILADAFDSSPAFLAEADPFGRQILESESTIFAWQADRLVAGQAIVAGRQVIGAVSIGMPTSRLNEKLAEVRNQSLGLALVIITIGVGMAFVFTRSITNPLEKTLRATEQMRAGDLSARINLSGKNELSVLAHAFNRMAEQLQQTIAALEQRNRAMATNAEISRRLSTLLETSDLVNEVVNQIQEAFGYYHVHIYLYDETRENLVMVGGTGEVSQEMLADKHQIEPGQGLVSRAAEMNIPVFVPDVSQDATWLPNPRLPETKAETAVPIVSGEKILGVLDVLHNIANGLTQLDVDLLESVANQVAVALRNATLYEEAREKAQREALLNEINQKILNTKDVQEAMQVAVREIGRATGASFAGVRLTATESQNGS